MVDAALYARYEGRTEKSRRLFHRLRRSLPGGETRSVTFYRPYPVALARGKGCQVWDVDGSVYVDVLNNYTALVHGHAYPPILDAIRTAAEGGTAFPAPSLEQADLAELLIWRYPAVERVRFTNSGTEAALLALRIARRATGRRRVVLFEGAYHGTAPGFMEPDPDFIRLPYNDHATLRACVDEDVAAVFAEPFLGSGGVIPATRGFLQEIRSVTAASGAVFVLDEVQSLRTHPNGSHAAEGITPDLVLMGKIIGGGLPAGAVGGRADLLELTAADREGSLSHSGTFNGNRVTVAAGLACLRNLDDQAIDGLNRLAERAADGILAVAAAHDIPVAVTRAGSILHVHAGTRNPATPGPPAIQEALHIALLLEGVYAAPRGMLNLSTPIDEHAVDFVVEAYGRAFAETSAWIEAKA